MVAQAIAVVVAALLLVGLAVALGGGRLDWAALNVPVHGRQPALELGDVRVALLAPFPPSMCGIAEHTSYLVEGLAGVLPRGLEQVRVVALQNGVNRGIDIELYNKTVVRMVLDPEAPSDFASAVRFLRREKVTFILVQHEFGLYSTSHESLVAFLQALRLGTGEEGQSRRPIPVLTVLHTVADPLSSSQLKMTRQLMVASDATAVMTARMKETLVRDGGAPDETVRVIPHGVPSSLWDAPASLKERRALRAAIFGELNLGDRPVCMTFGLLNWGKGIERIIRIMPQIVASVPNVAYVVLGEPHPGSSTSEEYYSTLQTSADGLGLIGKHVFFVRRFMESAQLSSAVRAADIFIAPYTSPSPVSGALPLAMASGVPAVTSGFQHARSLLLSGSCAEAPGCGRLVEDVEEEGVLVLVELLLDADLRGGMGARAIAAVANVSWPAVAQTYLDAGLEIAQQVHQPNYFEVLAARWPLYLRQKRREDLLRAIDADKHILASWAVKAGLVNPTEALQAGKKLGGPETFARHALAELVFSQPMLAGSNWIEMTNGSWPSCNGTWPGGNGTWPGSNGTWPGGNGTWPGGNGTWPGCNGTWPGGNGTWPGCNGTWPGCNGTWPSVSATRLDPYMW